MLFFLCLLKNIECGYSLEPPRRGSSNEYPQSMFWAEMWKISEFFIWKKFQFFEVKFSIYLNRRVFVMKQTNKLSVSLSLSLFLSLCKEYACIPLFIMLIHVQEKKIANRKEINSCSQDSKTNICEVNFNTLQLNSTTIIHSRFLP